jgi:hypothetical protein
LSFLDTIGIQRAVLNGTVGYEYTPAEKIISIASNSHLSSSRIIDDNTLIPIEEENENEQIEVNKPKTYTLSLDVIGDLIYPAIKLDKLIYTAKSHVIPTVMECGIKLQTQAPILFQNDKGMCMYICI